MIVELTVSEFLQAVNVGMQRMVTSASAGHNHASTYERTFVKRLQEETLGACGELAVCKALNRYWDPRLNTFHNVADIGDDIEVRSTDRDGGCLIVRENDPPERWYVLVTGEPPSLTVRGYIKGSKARRDEWVRDPHDHRAAWFVPQSELTPMPLRMPVKRSA